MKRQRRRTLLTIPNVICVARALLAPLMIVLAWNGDGRATLVLFLCLTISDFADGKIARCLNQRSHIGPRLDSFSDAIMYGCVTLALVFLRGQMLADEVIWIALAIGTYIAASCFALAKFGKLPSYHTRSAKTACLIVAIATATLLIGGPAWPLRLAMASVMIANIESGLLTHRLKRPISDIRSIIDLKE